MIAYYGDQLVSITYFVEQLFVYMIHTIFNSIDLCYELLCNFHGTYLLQYLESTPIKY